MKINWGTKLVFFALLFMGFIIYLSVRIMQTDVPMVEDNYYEKGLNYQKEIDNSAGIDSMIMLNVVNDDSGYQTLVLINRSSSDITEGKLLFYRPSDKKKDIEVMLSIPAKKVFQFPMRDLERGRWNLKFSWTLYGEQFHMDKKIER